MKQFSWWQLLMMGGLGYLAYKTGQNVEKNRNKRAQELLDEDQDLFNDSADEEIYVAQQLQDLRSKSNKTMRDKYNIKLLENKLNELRNNR